MNYYVVILIRLETNCQLANTGLDEILDSILPSQARICAVSRSPFNSQAPP